MRTLTVVSLILLYSIIIYGQTSQTIKKNLEVSNITIDDLNDIIKNREGRVLLINIWATWCIPCKEEFPDLINISDKYNEEVELIGISIDYPDEVETRIIPFLNKLNPNFANYVSVESDAEKFVNNLNSNWSGAIPTTFFYDVEFHVGRMSFEEIENNTLTMIN